MLSLLPKVRRHWALPLLLSLIILLSLAGCRSGDEPAPENSPVAPTAPQASAEDALRPSIPAATAVPEATSRIPADDPLIRYTGRIDFSDPKRPRFDWPSVTIEAAFTGSTLAVVLDDGLNSYNVAIDGQNSVLQTQQGRQVYPLAQGLADRQHTLRLTKRTETFYGTPAFLGLELDAGHKLVPLPPGPTRRIEFIGDSITAGYGTEGKSPTCTFTPETENVALTYAAQTAEALDASYTVAAVSGVGVVRNYNSSGKMSTGTMLAYYEKTIAGESASPWDFQRWVPDAVVINLGTNDFSTAPHPDGEVFLTGYTDLVVKVRNRYPNAHIFAVAGPLMVDPAESTILSAVTQMREVIGDSRIHFVPITNNLELSAVDFGCDWHPNASGHAKIAGQLIPVIAGTMGW